MGIEHAVGCFALTSCQSSNKLPLSESLFHDLAIYHVTPVVLLGMNEQGLEKKPF